VFHTFLPLRNPGEGAEWYRGNANAPARRQAISFGRGSPPHFEETPSHQISPLSAAIASTYEGRAFFGYQGSFGSTRGSLGWEIPSPTKRQSTNANEAARSGPLPRHVGGSSPPRLSLGLIAVSSVGHLPR